MIFERPESAMVAASLASGLFCNTPTMSESTAFDATLQALAALRRIT